MNVTTKAWCGECRRAEVFERPVTLEERTPDGPEWACTACGAAWIDLVTFEAAASSAARATGWAVA